VSARDQLAKAADWVARALRGQDRETGVAFAEADTARWGIKPYYADDLLASKALRLSVYRDMMRDATVKAAYLSRVFPVMATDWDVRPADYDARRRPDDDDPNVEAADFLRYVLRRLPGTGMLQLVFDLSRALVDGFAVIEKVLAPIERGRWAGRVGLAGLKAKDVDTWDFEVDEYLNIISLKQQVRGEWVTRDRTRFIVVSWLPCYANPLGQSEFRAAYRAFWVKDNAWKFRAIFLEALSKGRRKVVYPADQGDAGRQSAENLLTQLQESLGFAIPSDLQVDLVELATAPADVFASAIADCDKEIVVGLTGATLQMLEGAETGALRATETHARTSRPWTWIVGEWIAAAIQSDLVGPLHGLNFALDEPPEFYWRWTKQDAGPASETLERLQRMGVAIPAWYVNEQFDVPTPEEDDEILAPAAATALASPFGAGGLLGLSGRAGLPPEPPPTETDAPAEFAGDAPAGALSAAERRALARVPAANKALAEAILGQARRKKV